MRLSLLVIFLFVCCINIVLAHDLNASSSDSGFIFIEGKYIESPYKFEIKKGDFFVNGIFLKKLCTWPFPEANYIRPEIPAGVIKKSKSFDDLKIAGTDDYWHGRMLRWIAITSKNYEISKRRCKVFYKSLPFVDDVKYKKGTIEIRLKDGTAKVYGDISMSGRVAKDAGYYLREMEYEKNNIVKNLSKDGMYLFFKKDLAIQVEKSTVVKYIRLMVEILKSGKSDTEKYSLLKRMMIIPPHYKVERIKPLIDNFQTTKQLYERIDALAVKYNVKAGTIKNLPEKSPVELERERVNMRYQEYLRNKKAKKGKEESGKKDVF
ncbi:MAG: hypothetical protein ACYTFY_15455 [Planctomycetota bacterium]|jgi:hypothetical protein